MLDELCAQSFLSFKHINNINNIEDLSCFPFIQKVNKIHKIFFVCNYFSFAIHKTKIQLKSNHPIFAVLSGSTKPPIFALKKSHV